MAARYNILRDSYDTQKKTYQALAKPQVRRRDRAGYCTGSLESGRAGTRVASSRGFNRSGIPKSAGY